MPGKVLGIFEGANALQIFVQFNVSLNQTLLVTHYPSR
jgi:hypothetical protein